MTTPENYEAAYRRTARRFERTIKDESLEVSGLLEPGELLKYREQIISLSQEAFDHPSAEYTREWVDQCTRPLGTRAIVLTNSQEKLVGFTWGAPLEQDYQDINKMKGVSSFVAEQQERLSIEKSDVLYSSALAVAPEYRERRLGLGSGLALRALMLCRQELHPKGALLFYRMMPDNGPAHEISVAFGAQPVPSPFASVQPHKELWYGHIPPLPPRDDA